MWKEQLQLRKTSQHIFSTAMEGESHLGDSDIAAGIKTWDTDMEGSKGNVQGHKESVWRVRVCPIFFADFCNLKKDFLSMYKLTEFFEYRMSQFLCTSIDPGVWGLSIEQDDKGMPWLPNEKTFTNPRNAATAGLLEMKVLDSNLLDLVTLIRTISLSKKNRLRFELKRLPLEGAQQKEKQVEGEMEETAKTGAGNSSCAVLKTTDLLVNFAVRLQPMKVPAFSHPQGYQLQAKDKQIYVSKVPADIPDNVLKAILCSQLLFRQTAEDGTSTAVFHINSPFGAHGYMELFDGILVNYKELEMATSLGTLIDSKKKHLEQEEINRAANERQMQTVKRKPDGSLDSPQTVKRPREDLAMASQNWMRGKQPDVNRGALMRGAQQGHATHRPPLQGRGGAFQGAPWGDGERLQSRGGLPGRGALRGASWRGLTRGGRGMPERGAGRGRRMPSRGSASPGAWGAGGGYSGTDDLHQEETADGHKTVRGVAHRGGRFSPRGGYGPRRDFHDQEHGSQFEPGFPKPFRGRWN